MELSTPDPWNAVADGYDRVVRPAFTQFATHALDLSGVGPASRVLDVATGERTEDHVEWSKFSGASWAKDSSGFYYSRYDEPQGEDELKAVNYFHKLYFHKLGTPQSEDVLVYERPDHK